MVGGDRKNTLAWSRSCTLIVPGVDDLPRSSPGRRAPERLILVAMGINNARIVIPVVSFLCPKVTVVATVSFARKNETIESIAATLEQSALHMFLAAKVSARIKVVS